MLRKILPHTYNDTNVSVKIFGFCTVNYITESNYTELVVESRVPRSMGLNVKKYLSIFFKTVAVV